MVRCRLRIGHTTPPGVSITGGFCLPIRTVSEPSGRREGSTTLDTIWSLDHSHILFPAQTIVCFYSEKKESRVCTN